MDWIVLHPGLGSWLALCKFPSLKSLLLRRVGDHRGNQTAYDTLANFLMGLWHGSQAMFFAGYPTKSNLGHLNVEFVLGWDKMKLGYILQQFLPFYVPTLETITVQCGSLIHDDEDSSGEDNEAENNEDDDVEAEEDNEGNNSDEDDTDEDEDNASDGDQDDDDGTIHAIINDEDDTKHVGSLIQQLSQQLTVVSTYTPTFLEYTRTSTRLNIFGPGLRGFVHPRDKTADLTILKTYKRMDSLGPSLDTELEALEGSKVQKEIEYYLRINHAGRVLVERAECKRAIPLSLWPKVWVRSLSSHPPRLRRFNRGGHAARPNSRTGHYYTCCDTDMQWKPSWAEVEGK